MEKRQQQFLREQQVESQRATGECDAVWELRSQVWAVLSEETQQVLIGMVLVPNFPRKHAHNQSSHMWRTYYMLGIALGILYTVTFNLSKTPFYRQESRLAKIRP